MVKLLKSALALGLAALLLFACAACGGGNKPEPTEPETSEATTTEPESLDVAATTGEDETSEEPASVDETTTEAPSTKPGETTAEGATTTVAPTTVPGKPSTKAEIVAYYNTAVAKVKADKPGYSFQERTHIDDTKISSSKGFLNAIAPAIVKMAKGLFSKWTDPSVKAKGADHGGFPPKAEIKPEWIKSATCTESGNSYQIRLNLVDEHVPELPESTQNTIHGKTIDRGVYNRSSVMDGVEQLNGIDINKFACNYSGSYIDATVNKATGAIVKVTTWCSCQADVIAKVPVFGELDASVPLANESEYIF